MRAAAQTAYQALWLRTSPEALEHAERALFLKHVDSPFALARAAGVGTVIVPWKPAVHAHMDAWVFPNRHFRDVGVPPLLTGTSPSLTPPAVETCHRLDDVRRVLASLRCQDEEEGATTEGLPAAEAAASASSKSSSSSSSTAAATAAAAATTTTTTTTRTTTAGENAAALDESAYQAAFSVMGGDEEGNDADDEANEKPVLVLLHGYAGGTGHFFLNLQDLSRRFRCVYALDMYGCGRSDRVPFTAENFDDGVEFFTDAIERWRSVALPDEENFVLAGHSMGAIIVGQYALKHPERVEHLMLLSPAGLAPRPEDPPDSEGRAPSWPQRVFRHLWESQTTPMDLLRFFGPFSRNVTEWAINKRFSVMDLDDRLDDESLALFADYTHANYSLPASGEKALHVLLAAGAWGARPMMEWLHAPRPAAATEAKNDSLDSVSENGEQEEAGVQCPVSFVYGAPDRDWMNSRLGEVLASRLRSEGVDAEVYHVAGAGHLLFLENADGFMSAVSAAQSRAERSLKQRGKETAK